MEANYRLGIVAALVAFASRPILWLVGIGIVVSMWLRPATRSRARGQLSKWGGWPGLPRSAWRWASEGLSALPFAVLVAAGFVSAVSLVISWSFAYVPWVLAVSMLAAMVIPTFNDEIAARFGVGRSMNDERDK
jgi:hypothetical protein